MESSWQDINPVLWDETREAGDDGKEQIMTIADGVKMLRAKHEQALLDAAKRKEPPVAHPRPHLHPNAIANASSEHEPNLTVTPRS